MYTKRDFKSKAELKRALAAGVPVTIFQPGPFGGNEPTDGTVTLEGPHFPRPHSWYGRAKVVDGLVVEVK